MDMLRRTAPRIGRVDDVANYAYLEAFLIHYRNLLEFLAPSKAAREDADTITALDFLEIDLEAPVGYRTRIHKKLAHMSRTRRDPDNDWDPSEMLARLEVAWRRFIEVMSAVHPDRVSWFGGAGIETPFGLPQVITEAATTSSFGDFQNLRSGNFERLVAPTECPPASTLRGYPTSQSEGSTRLDLLSPSSILAPPTR